MDVLLEAQKVLDSIVEDRGSQDNADDLSPEELAHMEKVHALEDELNAAQESGRNPQSFQHLLSSAQRLQEQEMLRMQQRKRRREERMKETEERRKRVQEQQRTLHAQAEARANNSGSEMFRVFAELQAASEAHGLGLQCPEVVVVGMQSDGKSTFVEALLGFTFNIVSSNIGTRRPLVIQMLNSPDCVEPMCRFRIDNNDEKTTGAERTSTTSSSSSSDWEAKETPVARLTEEIVRRTNQVAGADRTRVSRKPIVLRVEYCRCANLTLYDTPGFRIGGDPSLAQDIKDMVLDLIRPSHRLIVCLEQSTVEWANTSSRPLVQQVDPELRRTILVHTKFDNRLKELRTKDEATKYLQGENLPADCRNFFISLPVDRSVDRNTYIELIDQCHMKDYEHLLRVGVSEDALLAKVGFRRLESFLEHEIARLYRAAFAPMLERLERTVSDFREQVTLLTKSIEERDPATLRIKASQYVHSLCNVLRKMLTGSASGDPERFGQTLSQERSACCIGAVAWTALDLGYPIENSQRKLYGGPQFHRLLNEFSWVGYSVEFPDTSIDEVAAALGTHPSHNVPSYESAACDLVQLKAKCTLSPLVDTATDRACYILLRLFDVAVTVLHRDNYSLATVGSCEPFLQTVRTAHGTFVQQLRANCRQRLAEDLESLTAVMDWDELAHDALMAAEGAKNNAMPEDDEDEDNADRNARQRETRKRVFSLMSKAPAIAIPYGREVHDKTYQAFIGLCSNLFNSIRAKFVPIVRNKLNTLMMKPMFDAMSDSIQEVFRVMPTDQYNSVFESGFRALEQQRATLAHRLEKATQLRDKFRAAGKSFMRRAQENHPTVREE